MESQNDQSEGLVLLFYFDGDESGSMEGKPVAALNAILPTVHAEIVSQPDLADKVRFCVLAFNSSAKVVLPMSDLQLVTSMPGFVASGGTSYKAAFEMLRRQIEVDVKAVLAKGLTPLRPCVFFLSDGAPNSEDWQSAHAALVDPGWPYHPNIISFGIGQANESVLSRVGTLACFMATSGVDPAGAIKKFAASLAQSMVKSASAVAAGQPSLMIKDPPGFTRIPVDALVSS